MSYDEIQLTPNLEQFLTAKADREWPNGEVWFRICPICGYAVWLSTTASKARKVAATFMDYNCDNCENVARRNPELVRWVLNVLAFQKEDIKS